MLYPAILTLFSSLYILRDDEILRQLRGARLPWGSEDGSAHAREAAEITLNDFSHRLDISPAYWSRIEREMEKPPKDELIEKAVRALGLSLDQAFIQARRFPPDMQRDIATAVHAYRTFKRQEDDQ
jgi:HTH-type transcriptional regulator, competence development regulator